MSADVVTSLEVQYQNVRKVCFKLVDTALEIQNRLYKVVPTGLGYADNEFKLKENEERLSKITLALNSFPEECEDVRGLYQIKNQLNAFNLSNLIFLAEQLKANMLLITDGDEENFSRRLWSYESIMIEARLAFSKVESLHLSKDVRDQVVKSIGILQKLVNWFDLDAPYGRCAVCSLPLKKAKVPGIYYKYCYDHRPESNQARAATLEVVPGITEEFVPEPVVFVLVPRPVFLGEMLVDRSEKPGSFRKRKGKGFRKGRNPMDF